VIYGASYDFNCWLADIDRATLELLYETGSAVWRGWWIQWRQGKTLSIANGKKRALFYDVISFFQQAFVKACDSYLGNRFEHRNMIVENKRLRSTFRPADIDEIIRYNDAELTNLVSLMNELRTRLHNVGLFPSRWDGPGAIAVALMQREGIKAHKAESPIDLKPAVRSAYFGGRFEVIKCGHSRLPAYEYDLNSAYPWALLDVPSLAQGEWAKINEQSTLPFAVSRVTYKGANSGALPQPLPCRQPNGTISYPRNVTGWYWQPEILAANEYVHKFGGTLTIHETWEFREATNDRPFSFIKPLYQQRKKLKAAGDGSHVGIKLGLNSLYGKLAQQVGAKQNSDGTWRIPPYHQLEWAGYVTSKCRAAVLSLAMKDLRAVIAFETDAVFLSHKVRANEGSGLGQWEYEQFDNLTYLQSGTYFATKEGSEVAKTRGVDRDTLTREQVLSAMHAGQPTVESRLTRFIGLGLALQGQFDKWRHWITAPKNLSLEAKGKRIHIPCNACVGSDFSLGGFHRTIIGNDESTVSSEYQILWENPGDMSEALGSLRESHYEGIAYEDD